MGSEMSVLVLVVTSEAEIQAIAQYLRAQQIKPDCYRLRRLEGKSDLRLLFGDTSKIIAGLAEFAQDSRIPLDSSPQTLQEVQNVFSCSHPC